MAKKKAPPYYKNWQGTQSLCNDEYFSYFEAAKAEAERRR